MSFRRGDVVLVDLDPSRGAEQQKVRPCVVVSNDASNEQAIASGYGVVTVVPLTSNVGRVFAFQSLVPLGSGLRVPSKAQAEQVRAVSVGRISKRVGALDAEAMAALEAALLLHLGL